MTDPWEEDRCDAVDPTSGARCLLDHMHRVPVPPMPALPHSAYSMVEHRLVTWSADDTERHGD